MRELLQETRLDLLPDFSISPDDNVSLDDDVRTQVWGVLGTLYPSNEIVERRKEKRFPFPYLVHLTPLDQDGATLDTETIVVVGKHLSASGIGFFHPQPLPYRRMIVSLETPGNRWLGFLVDLSWCRFTKQGWYESGGKFLETVLSPVATPDDRTSAE